MKQSQRKHQTYTLKRSSSWLIIRCWEAEGGRRLAVRAQHEEKNSETKQGHLITDVIREQITARCPEKGRELLDKLIDQQVEMILMQTRHRCATSEELRWLGEKGDKGKLIMRFCVEVTGRGIGEGDEESYATHKQARRQHWTSRRERVPVVLRKARVEEGPSNPRNHNTAAQVSRAEGGRD